MATKWSTEMQTIRRVNQALVPEWNADTMQVPAFGYARDAQMNTISLVSPARDVVFTATNSREFETLCKAYTIGFLDGKAS
jgi:hypothetical protein